MYSYIAQKIFPSYYRSVPDDKDVAFPLKVVINKQNTKVLFAEIDNDFADVLFSFLILPLGKIMYVLDKHYGDKTPHVIGSFNTLYHGLSDLHAFEFQRYGLKPWFLNPQSAYAFPFLNQKYSCDHSIYDLHEAYFVVLRVFTQEKASFFICDDLKIVANGNESMLQTFNNLGIDMADIDGAETRLVTLGLNEMMDFLKGLLTSRQPLTDMIFGTSPKSEHQTCILPVAKEATSNSVYNLKVVYQKSTNKLLFAQAEKDFVSYAATMLTIPLGKVDLHLGSNSTCYNKLHHLYRSLGDLISPKHLEGAKKVLLMKPGSFATILLKKVVSDILDDEVSGMYTITDDLTVACLCISSTLSLLNEMKISASDVEEMEFRIGLEEARNILRASLTSTHALSDGLNNPKCNILKASLSSSHALSNGLNNPKCMKQGRTLKQQLFSCFEFLFP